jgi:hypothetical protein
MAKLIEMESVERDYQFKGTDAIVETDAGKRLLIRDAFGGIDTLEGGAVRWRHGFAVELQPTDTLESLKTEMWNDETSLFHAVINAFDDSRPLLGIDPTNLAKSAGLI